MPRPNKAWEKKYGKGIQTKTYLLTIDDDVLSASQKLAKGVSEAQAIILQMLRRKDDLICCRVLLDMDDIQMHGEKIVKAYHEWSKNDYEKLLKGISDRDESLLKVIK